jgi:hypothetical protein
MASLVERNNWMCALAASLHNPSAPHSEVQAMLAANHLTQSSKDLGMQGIWQSNTLLTEGAPSIPISSPDKATH